jgi:hypothetical protein
MDCFVARAPLRKRFAFVAGNDDQTHLRDLAARFARVLACWSRPLQSEGAGNAGRPMRPQPRVRGVESTKAHALVRSHRNHPAFPTQWFYGFLRALPGDRLVDTVTGEVTSANLTPAPRRQDHTTSPSASAPFVKGASASTASRPAFVTIASRPSVGTGRRKL